MTALIVSMTEVGPCTTCSFEKRMTRVALRLDPARTDRRDTHPRGEGHLVRTCVNEIADVLNFRHFRLSHSTKLCRQIIMAR